VLPSADVCGEFTEYAVAVIPDEPALIASRVMVFPVEVKLLPVMVNEPPCAPEDGVTDIIVGAVLVVVVVPAVMVNEAVFDVPLLFTTVTAYSPGGISTPEQFCAIAFAIMTGGGHDVTFAFSIVPSLEVCGELTE
jgi:hypothetical protein